MRSDNIHDDLVKRTGAAVAHYWNTRVGQHNRQIQTGKIDQGLRSAVTGGAQMDGIKGRFAIPAQDLGIERFARTLTAHVAAFV